MEAKATILTVAAVVATGVVAYAIYFDYKRRNDVQFRRQIKKEKKRVNKAVSQQREAEAASNVIDPSMLREALEAVKTEPIPPLEQRESYFMTQVGMGEQLATQGPTFHLPAAIAFYRALRIYPAPAELIGIYEKTVPEAVFKLVVDMTNMDITSVVQEFYDVFPPKSMNVSVEKQESTSMSGARQVLIAQRDFAAGETIYQERPIVAALDQDVQIAGTHCTHCFRTIEPGLSIVDDEASAVLPSAYCSKSCLVLSKSRSHSLLFTLESPLPDELLVGPMPELGQSNRREAQVKFIEYLKTQQRNHPLLAARFVGRQVVTETQRIATEHSGAVKASTAEKADDYAVAEQGPYQLADYLERWRFVATNPPEEEYTLISNLLMSTLPGLEQFTTPERYSILVSKMAYNAFGVCFEGGRDNRPEPTARPEDVEKTRTPYGTQRQIGSAVYNVSAYLTHSCNPSARVSFNTGTTELHLIANHAVKKGDALTVAFVDVTQHTDEPLADCRRRRRMELARGWKFACGCDRCEAETKDIVEIAAAAPPVEAEEKHKQEPEIAAAAPPVEAEAKALLEPEPEPAAAASAPEPVPEAAPEVELEGLEGDQSIVEASVNNYEANPPPPVPLAPNRHEVE